MEVRIFYKKRGGFQDIDCETATAATAQFPTWVFWEKLDEKGDQRVIFVPEHAVKRVEMVGPPEKDDADKPAKLHILQGGEADGSVS